MEDQLLHLKTCARESSQASRKWREYDAESARSEAVVEGVVVGEVVVPVAILFAVSATEDVSAMRVEVMAERCKATRVSVATVIFSRI
jgi:hypothetical protein